MNKIKICKGCGVSSETKKFRKHKNHIIPWCYCCYNKRYGGNREKQKDTQRKNIRKYIYDYLTTNCCADCGCSNWLLLQFDHRDPKSKEFSISAICNNYVGGLTSLIKEIAKCDVVCANCHVLRTFKMFGSWRLDFATLATNILV